MPRRNNRSWARKTWTCHHAVLSSESIPRDAADSFFITAPEGIEIEVKKYIRPPIINEHGDVEDLTFTAAIDPFEKHPVYAEIEVVINGHITMLWGKYIYENNKIHLHMDHRYQQWWWFGNQHISWLDQSDHTH